jgi:hypothetical protein
MFVPQIKDQLKSEEMTLCIADLSGRPSTLAFQKLSWQSCKPNVLGFNFTSGIKLLRERPVAQ